MQQSTDVRDSLREFWETRPSRPRTGRMLYGVAAGIARRYDVDPTLIRVGLVVLVISGIGPLLYVAGCFALPGERRDPSAPPSGPSALVKVLGTIALVVVTLGSLAGAGWGWVFPTAAVVALVVLLHRRGSLGRFASTPVAPAADTTTHQVPVQGPVGEPGPEPPVPPSWDPLGAAPFAWDLPEPSPPPPPPVHKAFPVTLVTLALALIATSLTAVIMLLTGSFGPSGVGVLAVVALAVTAVGLIAGSFLHTGRGLIPVVLLVGLGTLVTTASPFEEFDEGQAVTLVAAPTAVAEVPPTTNLDMGGVEYDLSRLDLSIGANQAPIPVRLDVQVDAGYVEIVVPRDADVSLTADSGAGYVGFGSQERSGVENHLQVLNDLGDDGVAGGRPLVIDIQVDLGYVEVTRG